MDLSPLFISLKVALTATLITIFFGTAAARFVLKIKRFKGIIDGLFTLPMVLPPTVVGFFLLVLLGKSSPTGKLLMNLNINVVFTWVGAVIASAVVSFPLMYRTVRGAFEQFDVNIIYAARTLGMAESKIFRAIVLPNIVPGLIAGTILSFARALGEFGATMMLAGNIPGKTQTMSVAVYSAVQSGDSGTAYKWVAVVCAMSFTAMILMNFWNGRQFKKTAKRGDI